MGKKRVHEVAKQLGMGSKELIATLVDLGVDVKSHMSTLDHEAIEKLHRHLGQGNNQSNGAKPAEQAGKAKPQATEPQTGKKTEVQAGKGRTAKAVRLSQYGPGLVDKVPQRPPDRRFIERPMHIPVPIPKTSAEKREDTARSAKGTSPEVPQRTQVPAETPTPVEQPSSTPEVQDAKPAAPPRPQPPRQPATAVPYNQRVPQRPAGRPVQTTPPRPAYRDGQARPGYPGNGGATPHTGRPGQGPRTGGYQRPDNNVRVAPVKQPQQGRPPHYGDRSPHYGGRPTGAAQQHSRTQHAGRPAPGGRPATSRPQGRPGGPILSKSIPKPPAHLEATRPDKGAGLQRFADKKAKGKGAQDRRHWDKRDRYEERQVQHRRKPKSEKRIIPPAERKPIVISGPLTVKELAEKTGIKAAEIIKKLLFLGTMATINQEIDEDTAVLIAEDMGFTVELKPQVDLEAQLELETEEDVDPVNQVVRPPVVTVMGHVDHGKTSLLDAVRHTKVTASEAGGITQHIGAYQVTHNGKKISFLDTPGHEAFTAMRARGARVTDVAILVVAADDGVKPQTIEAINHAKAAEVPIVVAINKIDKPDANPERVKQQLIEHGLVAEEWGGDTIMVPVSALTGEGLDDLLEMILLVAEVNELKANPKRKARGTIIESRLDKGRGPVATVLVQNGTLNTGDVLVAGGVFARVRAMVDHKGRRVKKAGPSTPVEVLGFSDVPAAGEPFYVIDDEKVARQIAGKRQERKRIEDMKTGGRLSLEDVFKRIQEGDVKELPLIIKGDVQGSVEALSQALEKLSTEEVKVHLVHQGVGAITESDIMLASTANAIIIGFNVRPDVNARKAAERENVHVRLYQVIYDATSDVKAALSGLLDPEYREVLLGHAEVRKVFKASKVGTIAGCYVTDGKISRDAGVRVLRDGRIVFTGKVDSLKRFKDDVREVAQGYECGVTLEKFNDIEEGDELEFFTMEEVKRQL